MLDLLNLVIGPATGAVIAAVLAWLIGNRVAARWSLWQKRREAALVAVAEHARLYGEFFSIWKLWNYSLHDDLSAPANTQWALLERAASAEASVESLLVRLACESRLQSREIEIAGKFRQAYQQLREVIRDGTKLDWPRHNHPEYVAFKRLAAELALLVSAIDRRGQSLASEASAAILEITSNKWEACWTEPVGSPE